MLVVLAIALISPWLHVRCAESAHLSGPTTSGSGASPANWSQHWLRTCICTDSTLQKPFRILFRP